MPTQLRELFGTGKILVAPGAYDALSALLIERSGFNAIYVGGASTSYTSIGRPDLGFIGMEGMASQISRIRNSVELPLICDADTGYGNEVNVAYTVRLFERSGAGAIQIEDQVSPKRCGHLSGKEVTDPSEMEIKIRAAVETRKEAMIIARTDSLAINGKEDAVERANRYLEAGADMVFVESPRTVDDLRYIGRNVKGLKMANMVEGGRTPMVKASELQEMGFNLVIYPGAAVRAATMAVMSMLDTLKSEGSTASYLGNMVEFTALQDILGTDDILKLKIR